MSQNLSSTGCCLCGWRDAHLRHSHVLPELLYDGVYDHRHRTVDVDPRPEARDNVLQKGLREYLLCGDCEGHISVWEHYAADVLRRLPPIGAQHPGDVFHVHNVDYQKFKLFQMSVIWRCSIAQGVAFARVNLGPHEDKVRRMLLADDPGSSFEYPCVLAALRPPGSLVGMVKFPGRLRIEGQIAYHLVARGLIWVFVVSKDSESLSGQGSFLSQSGELPIHIGSETAKGFFRGVGREMKKYGEELSRVQSASGRTERCRPTRDKAARG
jgi:hypothetical protein